MGLNDGLQGPQYLTEVSPTHAKARAGCCRPSISALAEGSLELKFGAAKSRSQPHAVTRAMLSRSAYPTRSILRYGLEVFRSISQNIQTKAAPRQTTITRNSNVNAGAVSMFNILDQMQTVYQRTELKPRPR